jgi:membrane-associated protease RseP (regulator of RpoE activity)
MPNEISEAKYSLLDDNHFEAVDDDSLVSRIRPQKYWLHLLLFVTTLLTTSLAGLQWLGRPSDVLLMNRFSDLAAGFPYALSLVGILACHEFGHFFASVYHRIKATLPFFIPMPPLSFLLNIGTFGAVIRTRERIRNSVQLFDIGVYGPLSGFVVALGILIYGFATLPPLSYLYTIHPEYALYGGEIPVESGSFMFGKNLLYWLLEKIFNNPNTPPMTEVYHYPFLCAGWIGCLVTALNMLPVGQLDGGHIIYAMFGLKTHRVLARVFLGIILALGLPVLAAEILAGYNNTVLLAALPAWYLNIAWPGWTFWALMLIVVVKIDHPPVMFETPLDARRRWIGWASLVMFALCFTPVPFGFMR